jgi:hypothetical protein
LKKKAKQADGLFNWFNILIYIVASGGDGDD